MKKRSAGLMQFGAEVNVEEIVVFQEERGEHVEKRFECMSEHSQAEKLKITTRTCERNHHGE